MGNTLKEVIDALEKVAAPTAESTPATPAAAPVEPQVNEKDAELRKLAEEYDAAGRIMAFAFADELQKIAVGVTGVTPNTAAVPENPTVQVSDEDIQLGNVQAVVGQLRAVTQGAEAKMTPAGKVEANTVTSVSATPASVAENPPVAYDAAKAQEEAAAAKQASSAVVGKLYEHFFGN